MQKLVDWMIKGIRYGGGRTIVESCFLIANQLGIEQIEHLVAFADEDGIPIPPAARDYKVKTFRDDTIQIRVHEDFNLTGSANFDVSVDFQSSEERWERVFTADGATGAFVYIDYDCFRRGEWCVHLLKFAKTLARQNKVETWNDRFRPLKSRKKKSG